MYFVAHAVLSLLTFAACLFALAIFRSPSAEARRYRNIYSRSTQLTTRASASSWRRLDGAVYAAGYVLALPYLWYRYGAKQAALLISVPIIGTLLWSLALQVMIEKSDGAQQPVTYLATIVIRGLIGGLIAWRGGLWEMKALRARGWTYEGNAEGSRETSAIQSWSRRTQ